LKDKSDLDKVRVKSDWIFKLSNDSAHPLLKDRTTFMNAAAERVCRLLTTCPNDWRKIKMESDDDLDNHNISYWNLTEKKANILV
jgi:hypothetical protein